MWVVRAFMWLNVDFCDVEKYLLKWLRVLGYGEGTWIRVLCMLIKCYLIDYYFNNMLNHWLNGCALIWH